MNIVFEMVNQARNDLYETNSSPNTLNTLCFHILTSVKDKGETYGVLCVCFKEDKKIYR